MGRTTFLLVFLLLFAGATAAQVRVATPLVSSPGAERPVQLQSARIEIERIGSQARTTLELVLHNPNGRDLEGQLAFPLRPGQQVSGFALDIEGQMHDAVPVPKERGREVFEQIERARVDPALLERTEGNFFRLRVYPIAAGGVRRVRLSLVEPLERVDENLQLRLPLDFARDLRSVPVRLRSDLPVATAGGARLDFETTAQVAQLGPRQLKDPAGLVLRWPQAALAPLQIQAFEGHHFFHAELALPQGAGQRKLPQRVGLLWDASASGRKRDAGLEFALLDRYFRAVGSADVQLQLVRDRSEAPRAFKVSGGDWTALKAALRAVVYDGATDLSTWKPDARVQEYLLVSDGLANYGSAAMPALAGGQRLYAINSAGAQADSARLRALAEARGGRLVELASADDLERATRALLREATRIVAIDAVGARDVVAGSRFADEGVIRLAGRITASRGRLDITVEEGGRQRSVPLDFIDARTIPGNLLAQTWAGYRLRELEAEPTLNRTAIRELGQRYGLATGETSLIVLESLEDYLRYDIAPPSPWREAFLAARGGQADAAARLRRDHLESVVLQFAEKTAWWDTDFRGRAPKSEEARPAPTGSAPQVANESMASPMDAAAPAAPRAMVGGARAREAQAEEAPSTLDSVEVTGSRIKRSDIEDAGGTTAVITLQPWAPDSDFARRLRAAPAGQVYALYLDEREAHADSTAFYLDVADILLEKGQRDLALRVLSNLAELQLENRHLLRVLGYRLMQAKAVDEALPIFQRVLAVAGEEPQSHRDLALALDLNGRPQAAIEALYEVVTRPWDDRFGGIHLIALAELNAIIARHPRGLDTARVDPRLLRNLPMALRAVLTWDSDNTDMDLWVTQPDGERCYYSNQRTAAGGRMSDDFTGGYGPEEYAIRRAAPGKYRVEVNYFGDSQQVVAGVVTVQLWLSTGFGTPRQKDQWVTVRLARDADNVLVGEFEVR